MDDKTYDALWELISGARDLITPDTIEDAICDAGSCIIVADDALVVGMNQPDTARAMALDAATRHNQYFAIDSVVEAATKFHKFLIGGA